MFITVAPTRQSKGALFYISDHCATNWAQSILKNTPYEPLLQNMEISRTRNKLCNNLSSTIYVINNFPTNNTFPVQKEQATNK